MRSREHILQTINTLYGEVFNKGKHQLMERIFAGPYIQHNPLFPDGIGALAGYLQTAGSLPNEVKRVGVDGDLAFVHVRYPDWNGRETAGIDIYRFDSRGKIVEHWDVLQPVPAESANANTMF